jgi:DNA-binding winged helix-turn-helix (wHTH) protein/Tol biopolymer transport system component
MVSKSFVFRFDDVEVREREFALTKAGKVLAVEPKAFRALLLLLRSPQKVVSKEELLDSVWGDTAVTEGSLTRCVWLLRRVLGDDVHHPRYIETVATVGYRFVRPVEVFEDVAAVPEAMKEPNGLSGVHKTIGNQKRLWSWVAAGGVAFAVCLAATSSFLRRPLPPPRVTGYAQITHDGQQKNLAGTDGTRLYFNQMSGPTLPVSIAQVDISGGTIAQVPVALLNPFLSDISPDGAGFLVYSMKEALSFYSLWNVRILGGSARRLIDIDGYSVCAAFSPDGNSAAFAQQGDIYVLRSDGTGAHRLVSTGDDLCHIAWSPNGGAIRFTMKDRIWEVSSNGSGLHEVIPGWRRSSTHCCGRWTSDGKFFLFLSDGQIWALDERRALLRKPPDEPTQLTQGPIRWGPPAGKFNAWEFWPGPIPSKDGRKIFAQAFSPRGELARLDSKTKQFQPFLGGISAQGVAFSKDGKSIAYVSYPEGILWKANRDGSNPVQLTDPPTEVLLPRWSPDSKQISFLDYTPGTDAASYVVSTDGGTPRKILPKHWQRDGLLTWSPDGHRMVGSWPSVDGKVVVQILNLDTRRETAIPGSEGLLGPRWSPDGRYVAACTFGGVHLKIFDFKTQQWSELRHNGTVDSPEWSADSQFIYFKRVMNDRGIFRIRIHGGTAEKIADLNDFHDAGWFGDYMGLDPADAPLLLRDIGSTNIYALTLEEK